MILAYAAPTKHVHRPITVRSLIVFPSCFELLPALLQWRCWYFQIEIWDFCCFFSLFVFSLDDDGNIAVPSVVESFIFIGGCGFRVVNVLAGRRASECANRHWFWQRHWQYYCPLSSWITGRISALKAAWRGFVGCRWLQHVATALLFLLRQESMNSER